MTDKTVHKEGKRQLVIKKIHCKRCNHDRGFDKRSQINVDGIRCTKCGAKQ